jgi:hypothetical protein
VEVELDCRPAFLTALTALTLVFTLAESSLASDSKRNFGEGGYYSGTPLGAATADPYGGNHYYVPGYALSPGLRALQSGAGVPVYGQPYAPDERLRATRPEDEGAGSNEAPNEERSDDLNRR